MSGGNFGGIQFRLCEVLDKIEELIRDNGNPELDDFGHPKGQNYPPEILARFAEALHTIRRADIMIQRIDYLIDGDDSEETFMERWNDELGESAFLRGLELIKEITKGKKQ